MKMLGVLTREIAIIQPGMFLSHPPMVMRPSNRSAPATTSIESAMTSLLTNEYFIPSCPIEIPSETVIVPNVCGTTPALRHPSWTCLASLSMCMLQGVTSLHVLAMPTIGFLKSASVNPVARNMARFGARPSPSVITVLRGFRLTDLAIVVSSWKYTCLGYKFNPPTEKPPYGGYSVACGDTVPHWSSTTRFFGLSIVHQTDACRYGSV